MLPGSNQVFIMEIGRFQSVEQRQVTALALIEAHHFLSGSAALRGDEFCPTIFSAIENSPAPKSGLRQAVVEPGEQLLKMQVDGHRSWLIDQLSASAKTSDQNRSSILVSIS